MIVEHKVIKVKLTEEENRIINDSISILKELDKQTDVGDCECCPLDGRCDGLCQIRESLKMLTNLVYS